jgi:transcriptional regulator with XRE-family HTH domain
VGADTGRSFAEKLSETIEGTRLPGIGKGRDGRFTLTQIGDAVGVSIQTVANWRDGVSPGPRSSKRRRRLEELFGKPKHYFDDDYDEPGGRQPEPDPQTALIRAAMADAQVREILGYTVAEDDDTRLLILDILRSRAARRRNPDPGGT